MPFWGWLLLVVGAFLIFGYLVDKFSKSQRNITGGNHIDSIKTDAQNDIFNRDRNSTF
ncbi:hypothetical protein [Sutcliffiella cohnii]|uniref:hypothetical protein n=1 Tax=Sutcliffiella cohnii TaxID=33932 RepID=UPI000AA0E71F|nr:hypothetical protein [Sutcliffiella cohnii]